MHLCCFSYFGSAGLITTSRERSLHACVLLAALAAINQHIPDVAGIRRRVLSIVFCTGTIWPGLLARVDAASCSFWRSASPQSMGAEPLQ